MQKQGRLTVKPRKQTGALTISGTLYYADGTPFRVQRAAKSGILEVAGEEARQYETEWYKRELFGVEGGADDWTLGDAVEKYLDDEPRSVDTQDRLDRLKAAIGVDTLLADINQDTITKLRKGRFTGLKEATLLREGITPLTAVLTVAQRHHMLDRVPKFTRPKRVKGRTVYFMPDQAERMVAAAAPHLEPLLIFLLATGARLSEALYLDWRDVNLAGGQVIFQADRTKSQKDRHVELVPRVVAALANLAHREGMVFRTDDGKPYAINKTKDDRHYGGQIKTAWKGARKRAGLGKEFTPHTCRHTWASWHYALNLDPFMLRDDGGWADVKEVQTYAHRMLRGHEVAISTFLGLSRCDAGVTGSSADLLKSLITQR
jgi:integrase